MDTYGPSRRPLHFPFSTTSRRLYKSLRVHLLRYGRNRKIGASNSITQPKSPTSAAPTPPTKSSTDLNKEPLPDTPLESSAPNTGNIPTENLHNVCYVLNTGMDIYENKVVNGVSQCNLTAIARSFAFRVFHSIHSLGGHAVLLSYDKDSALPPNH